MCYFSLDGPNEPGQRLVDSEKIYESIDKNSAYFYFQVNFRSYQRGGLKCQNSMDPKSIFWWCHLIPHAKRSLKIFFRGQYDHLSPTYDLSKLVKNPFLRFFGRLGHFALRYRSETRRNTFLAPDLPMDEVSDQSVKISCSDLFLYDVRGWGYLSV